MMNLVESYDRFWIEEITERLAEHLPPHVESDLRSRIDRVLSTGITDNDIDLARHGLFAFVLTHVCPKTINDWSGSLVRDVVRLHIRSLIPDEIPNHLDWHTAAFNSGARAKDEDPKFAIDNLILTSAAKSCGRELEDWDESIIFTLQAVIDRNKTDKLGAHERACVIIANQLLHQLELRSKHR